MARMRAASAPHPESPCPAAAPCSIRPVKHRHCVRQPTRRTLRASTLHTLLSCVRPGSARVYCTMYTRLCLGAPGSSSPPTRPSAPRRPSRDSIYSAPLRDTPHHAQARAPQHLYRSRKRILSSREVSDRYKHRGSKMRKPSQCRKRGLRGVKREAANEGSAHARMGGVDATCACTPRTRAPSSPPGSAATPASGIMVGNKSDKEFSGQSGR